MQTFEQKVRAMSAYDIIMAMVTALTKPPIINIDMRSFGHVGNLEKKYLFGLITITEEVCFGCAATNTICKIHGEPFTKKILLLHLVAPLLLMADTIL